MSDTKIELDKKRGKSKKEDISSLRKTNVSNLSGAKLDDFRNRLLAALDLTDDDSITQNFEYADADALRELFSCNAFLKKHGLLAKMVLLDGEEVYRDSSMLYYFRSARGLSMNITSVKAIALARLLKARLIREKDYAAKKQEDQIKWVLETFTYGQIFTSLYREMGADEYFKALARVCSQKIGEFITVENVQPSFFKQKTNLDLYPISIAFVPECEFEHLELVVKIAGVVGIEQTQSGLLKAGKVTVMADLKIKATVVNKFCLCPDTLTLLVEQKKKQRRALQTFQEQQYEEENADGYEEETTVEHVMQRPRYKKSTKLTDAVDTVKVLAGKGAAVKYGLSASTTTMTKSIKNSPSSSPKSSPSNSSSNLLETPSTKTKSRSRPSSTRGSAIGSNRRRKSADRREEEYDDEDEYDEEEEEEEEEEEYEEERVPRKRVTKKRKPSRRPR